MNRMLAALLMATASCLFQNFTQDESTNFAKYNAFIDTSVKGTFIDETSYKIQGSYLNSTNPSPIDERQFEDVLRQRLKFDGNTGLRADYFKLASTDGPINNNWEKNFALSEWTISIWFMATEIPLKEMTVLSFEINQAFDPILLSCSLTSDFKMNCFPEVSFLSMSLDLKQIDFKLNHWYQLIIDSFETYHRLTVISQSWNQIIDKPIVTQNPTSMSKVTINLGLKKGAEQGTGFKGYLKGFKMFNKMFFDTQIWTNAAFSYIYPEGNPSLLLELSLDDFKNTSGRFEQVNKVVFEVFQANGVPARAQGITEEPDLSPRWDCFYQDPTDFKEFFRFQGPNTQLENITLTNYKDTSDQFGSYQTTLKMWIYRTELTSFQGEVKINSDGKVAGRLDVNGDFLGNEILFKHDGIMTLTFQRNTSDYLTIYQLDDEQTKIQVKVPRGRWVWLVVEHSEYYFSARIEDMDKRLISHESNLVSHKTTPNFKTNSKYANIAPNFFGYIRGIQYYRNLQINKDPVYFQEATSSNSSLLFYFKFDRPNMELGQFKNLATDPLILVKVAKFNDTVVEVNPYDPNQRVIRSRNKQLLFDRLPFKPRTEKYKTGDLQTDIKWGLIQCNTTKLNLKLYNQNSNATLNFNTKNKTLDELYLGVWFQIQSESKNLPTGPFVKLTSLNAPSKVYLELRIESNQLQCSLYDTETGTKRLQTVTYSKFGDWLREERWMHAVCYVQGDSDLSVITGKNQLLGILYSQGEKVHYAGEQVDQSSKNYRRYQRFMIEEQLLKVQVNGLHYEGWFQGHNPNDGIFVQDLRIWNRVLKNEEILINRHQKVFEPEKDQTLLVYAPLLEGVRYPFKYFNYVNRKTWVLSQSGVQITSTKFVNDKFKNLLVCPYYFVYSLAEKSCVLKLFKYPQQIEGIVLKSRFSAGFELRLDDISYLNSSTDYFRAVAPTYTKNTWKLINQNDLSNFMIASALRQENSQSIQISDTDLETVGAKSPILVNYGLSITSRIQHGLIAPLNANFSLKLNPCASFFDFETESSYVTKPLTLERGTVDFEFSFSGTGCEGYNFDLNDNESFKLYLFFGDQPKYEFSKQSQLARRVQNKVTVDKNLLSSMPFNEPFYIVCSAKFMNAKKEGFAQDLSIIYKLQWQSSIRVILAQQDIGIPNGQDLLVDASDVYVINTGNNEGLKNSIRWQWLCPSNFDCGPISTGDKRLIITRAQLGQVKQMDFMTKYSFILRLSTSRNLPEDVPYVQKVVNVTWLGEPKNVVLLLPQATFSISTDVFIQVQTEDQGWFSECTIEWVVFGSDTPTWQIARALKKETDFKNSDNQTKFIINKNTLLAFGKYSIYLRLYAKYFDKPLVYQTNRAITVVTNPYGGDLQADWQEGLALGTLFTLRAPKWLSYKDKTDGLQYQFTYKDASGKRVAIAPLSPNVDLKTTLPATKQIGVRVIDDLEGISERTLDINVLTNLSMRLEHYQNRLEDISQKIVNSNEPFSELQQLFIWSTHVPILADKISKDVIFTLSSQILSSLEICLQKLKFLSEKPKRTFLTQTAFYMLKQIQQLGPNRKNLLIIESSLDIIYNVVTYQSQMLMEVIGQNQVEQPEYLLQFVASILNDINGYSSGLGLYSNTNKTLSVQTMQYRMMLSPLEAVIGQSIADGQKIALILQGLEVYMQKYSKQNTELPDFYFQTRDQAVQVKYPLKQIGAKESSQTLSLYVFSNKDFEAEEAVDPHFNTRGGPFSGKRFMSQKILSNNTVYLTYRGSRGQELQTDDKVEITFLLNSTDYLKELFDTNRASTFKCAYIPTTEFNFDLFKTDKCTTQVISDQNRIVYDSEAKNAVTDILTRLKELKATPYDLMKNSPQLKVVCRCDHMSYFTIIEDIPIDSVEVIKETQKNLSELPAFSDWYTFLVLFLIVTGAISSMIYSYSLDNQDVQKMKKIEDIDLAPDHKPDGKKQQPKYSMMSWVFKRRLVLDKYCNQNLRGCCQRGGDKVNVTTWTLFKMYMAQIHPLFSVQYYHDISVLRFDRVMALLLKTVMCFGLIYFSLSPIQFETIEVFKFFKGEFPEYKNWLELSETRVFFVFVASVLILFPIPSCCFNTCRAQHKLQVQVMSEGLESEAFKQYLFQAQILRNTSLPHTQAAQMEAQLQPNPDESTYSIKDVKIFIDPLWPISVLMTINAMPYETLQIINPLLQRPYTSRAFRKIIDMVEKESNLMQQEVLGHIVPEDEIIEEVSGEDVEENEVNLATEKGNAASSVVNSVTTKKTERVPEPEPQLGNKFRQPSNFNRSDSDILEYQTQQKEREKPRAKETSKQKKVSVGQESVEMEDESFSDGVSPRQSKRKSNRSLAKPRDDQQMEGGDSIKVIKQSTRYSVEDESNQSDKVVVVMDGGQQKLARLIEVEQMDDGDNEAVLMVEDEDMNGMIMVEDQSYREPVIRIAETQFENGGQQFIQDENGEILQLQEIDLVNGENEMYGVEDDGESSELPELVFVDEKKELVYVRSLFSKVVSRLTILLMIFVILAVWIQDYFFKEKWWVKQSFLWQSTFLLSQAIAYIFVIPICLWIHAFLMANRVYIFLACKSPDFVCKLMPHSLMLYYDLLEQSKVMKDMKRRRKEAKLKEEADQTTENTKQELNPQGDKSLSPSR